MKRLIQLIQLIVELRLFLLLLLDGSVGAHEIAVQLLQLFPQIDRLLGQLPVVLLQRLIGVVGFLLHHLQARHFLLDALRLGFGGVDLDQRLVQFDSPISEMRVRGRGGGGGSRSRILRCVFVCDFV